MSCVTNSSMIIISDHIQPATTASATVASNNNQMETSEASAVPQVRKMKNHSERLILLSQSMTNFLSH